MSAPLFHHTPSSTAADRSQTITLIDAIALATPGTGAAIRISRMPAADTAVTIFSLNVPAIMGALVKVTSHLVPECCISVPHQAACILLVPDVLHLILVEIACCRIQAICTLIMWSLFQRLIKRIRIAVKCSRNMASLNVLAATAVDVRVTGMTSGNATTRLAPLLGRLLLIFPYQQRLPRALPSSRHHQLSSYQSRCTGPLPFQRQGRLRYADSAPLASRRLSPPHEDAIRTGAL
mmetsp:Transcript_58625/g.110554  ORF Transcript_58625/g.110554 Transcript_58625/m.110554 type:complete len:236 (-) Transcript_58625:365-1072(-)